MATAHIIILFLASTHHADIGTKPYSLQCTLHVAGKYIVLGNGVYYFFLHANIATEGVNALCVRICLCRCACVCVCMYWRVCVQSCMRVCAGGLLTCLPLVVAPQLFAWLPAGTSAHCLCKYHTRRRKYMHIACTFVHYTYTGVCTHT